MTKSTQQETLLSKLSSLSKCVDAPCPVGKLHKSLDKETALAFLTALQSPASSKSIHQALIDEGYSISRTTINQRRQCFKSGTDKSCLCFPNNLEK